jgi:ABC-type polysaccharide/polyol phosphate export permease
VALKSAMPHDAPMSDRTALVAEHRMHASALHAPFRMIGNIGRYRHLLRHFISRDLKMRYHGSVLGYAWSILEPLALTVTFYILFEILSESADPHRPLNILLGILIWTFFSRLCIQGTVALQRNSGLIQRVYFPRELFHFSIAGFQLIHLVLSLFILIPMMVHYDIIPSVSILLFPASILLICMLGLGISFFTCILQTRMRDIEHIIQVGLRIGFYLTPVFYNLEMITSQRIPAAYVDAYLYANPMATYLTMARSGLTGSEMGISQHHLMVTIIGTIVLFFAGAIFFSRAERKAVKYL